MEGQLSLNVSVYPCSWLQRGAGDGDDYLLCGRLHCHPYDHICLCPQRSQTISGHCSHGPVFYSRYFISFFLHFARLFVRCFVTGKSSETASWVYLQILTFWIAFIQNCVLCSRQLLTIVSEISCKSGSRKGGNSFVKENKVTHSWREEELFDTIDIPRHDGLLYFTLQPSLLRCIRVWNCVVRFADSLYQHFDYCIHETENTNVCLVTSASGRKFR